MVYISDLDSTLLNDKAQLSEYSKNELNELIEKGLNFTVATARSIISIQKILHGLNLKLPIIEFNGAFLTDFNSGNHLVINNIDLNIISELVNVIRSYKNEPYLSSFNGVEDKLYYEKIINDGMNWYIEDRIRSNDTRLTKVDNILNHIVEKIVCFTIINRKEYLLDLYNKLQKKYNNMLEILLMENAYSPGWFWLTLHNVNATKDKAILGLLKMYNFNINDLVVFGDNLNDVPMFSIAPKSIAVENSTDEIKRIASLVIGNNNDDSVVQFIKSDYFGRSCT